jgi:hypothetical protein
LLGFRELDARPALFEVWLPGPSTAPVVSSFVINSSCLLITGRLQPGIMVSLHLADRNRYGSQLGSDVIVILLAGEK